MGFFENTGVQDVVNHTLYEQIHNDISNPLKKWYGIDIHPNNSEFRDPYAIDMPYMVRSHEINIDILQHKVEDLYDRIERQNVLINKLLDENEYLKSIQKEK